MPVDVIVGDFGSGKSKMAFAIAAQLKQRQNKKIFYYSLHNYKKIMETVIPDNSVVVLDEGDSYFKNYSKDKMTEVTKPILARGRYGKILVIIIVHDASQIPTWLKGYHPKIIFLNIDKEDEEWIKYWTDGKPLDHNDTIQL